MLAAALLTDKPVTLGGVPQLQDIRSMYSLLRHMGVRVTENSDSSVVINAESLHTQTAPYDLVRKMRASFLVLGPLVARFHQAKVSLPGGCAIGTRPVDQHIKALQALGAKIEVEDGYVVAFAAGGLQGAVIEMDVVTVTGTQNAILAATLAEGSTEIHNAACEPEVVALADLLTDMGAKIEGAGTPSIRIEGVSHLKGVEKRVPTDRIEAGTYLIAAYATGGKITITDAPVEELHAVIAKLEEAGAKIEVDFDERQIHLDSPNTRPQAVDLETAVYPGLPTDLQAQFMALNCIAKGTARITENIFENRFMHVQELVRLGAKVHLNGSSEAIVEGVTHLISAPVMATDLRASSCLVIAGLIADGETVVNRIYHLDRGYEDLDRKLASLGATLCRGD